ncbi:MAG: DUF362 domain-containing protein [bacterium]|nr:DUF362 domain-containing protein [bacterium]
MGMLKTTTNNQQPTTAPAGRSLVSVCDVVPDGKGDYHQGVLDTVASAMELAGWRGFITSGADISLKVNLGWDVFMPGSVTSPWVLEGVVRTIRDYVGRIYVVESDQVLVSADKALQCSGIGEMCRRLGVEWANMSRLQEKAVALEDGYVFKEVMVPEILLRTEVITIPVIKSHNKTVITGSLKNQWGCIGKLRHNYHPVVHQAIADVNRAVQPRFAVMDGTIGMEGNAPKSGRPRIVNLVLASGDLVALDTVQAVITGFDPAAVKHLGFCSMAGLGVNDPERIVIKGRDIDSFNLNFAPAVDNLVSKVEVMLRSSIWRRLVFDTGLFDFFCWGANVWYAIWLALHGRSLRRIVMDSPYGRQWCSDGSED